jgi:chromosome segregation ATPase
VTNTNTTRIDSLDTRLQATEAELDNVGDLGARLTAVDSQLKTLTTGQTTITRRLDELNIRTTGLDTINNRLTAVESASAEQRNSIARLNDSLTSSTRLIDSRLGRIETRIPIG